MTRRISELCLPAQISLGVCSGSLRVRRRMMLCSSTSKYYTRKHYPEVIIDDSAPVMEPSRMIGMGMKGTMEMKRFAHWIMTVRD
jgi:hypothetical protein